MQTNPEQLAIRIKIPSTNAPIANSPYATKNAAIAACGKTTL
jgi:hypothetical protein